MKYLKIATSAFLFLTLFVSCSNGANDFDNNEILIASWNVENLFDTIDEPVKKDEWFTPEGERNWTAQKLEAKIENLSKVILDMKDGNGPDILGIQEVENIDVLKMLTGKLNVKRNYEIVHYESPDTRGIDNALIFDSDLFELKSSQAVKIELEDDKTTRDILHAALNYHGEIINVFVNHWPSRREGLKETEKRRIKAAETLFNTLMSMNKDDKKNLIILGDFNDLPSNISLSKTLGAADFDCAAEIPDSAEYLNLSYNKFKKGEGTYKYRDHWNMLDQIIISGHLYDREGLDYKCNSFLIFKPEYLIQKEGKYKGTSLPTYGGRKYLGGYSDHFAVSAIFHFIEN